MSLESIVTWHERACPEPDQRAFDVQLGCHFEEILEMVETLALANRGGFAVSAAALRQALREVSSGLKSGDLTAHIADREDFLDAACDLVVTAVGAAYRAGMDTPQALRRVDASNWSKFDERGEPLRDENGKIRKGPGYCPPVLIGLY